MTKEDASDYYGYTPPRLAVKPLSDMFQFPWDTLIDTTVVAEPRHDYPHSPHKDPLLEKLADVLSLCSEKHGCDACPSGQRCNEFWDGVSETGSHRHLTQEMLDRYRVEFEGKIQPR